jgi:hypothetical protein
VKQVFAAVARFPHKLKTDLIVVDLRPSCLSLILGGGRPGYSRYVVTPCL